MKFTGDQKEKISAELAKMTKEEIMSYFKKARQERRTNRGACQLRLHAACKAQRKYFPMGHLYEEVPMEFETESLRYSIKLHLLKKT